MDGSSGYARTASTIATALRAPSGASNRWRRGLLAALLFATFVAAAASDAQAKAEPLDPDEEALFLPSTARQLDDGRFEVDLQAWIHERDRHEILDDGLARYLGLTLGTMPPATRRRYAERSSLFHAEPEEGTVLEIDFGHGTPPVVMPPSNAGGRTQLRVTLALEPDPHRDPWLTFHTRGPGPAQRIEGRVLLVPPSGLSVISDIDDTVKITEVRSAHQVLLLNTFVRPFKAVPGMAERYQNLARDPQTRFHYLSSSPIQLLPALADFLRAGGFPSGSMHLRESTTWRTLIPGSGESRAHKLAAITQLLGDFPLRRFLLIGDSGELDPEIYGEVARTRPERIEGVVIRDVTGEGRASARYASAFAGVPSERWHVFRDGEAWPLH